jgi:hypothetical protein
MTACGTRGRQGRSLTKFAARKLREIKSILSTFASAPAGFFVSCVIGKAYPDAFSGADDRRLKAIRDAWIRATSACFPQIEATRG